MDFEKLMAKAMAVTQQQDAALAEKARRKLKEEDERRMRELKAERERQRLQEQLERKKNEEQQQQSKDKKKRKGQVDVCNNKKSNSNKLTTPKRNNSKSNAIAALQQLQPSAQKKDMSFEELMAQANKLQKKQSDPTSKIPSPSMSKKNERSTISGKRPPASASSSHTPRNNNNNNNNDHNNNNNNNNNNNTPSIYRNRRPTMSKSIRDSSRPIPASTLNMSARDKVRQMMRQPPQKLNTQKRDLRSVSEIQRDIRHKKGIYSDEEEDTRSDPRLLQNKRGSLENRYNNNTRKMSSGPLPNSRSSFPAGKRPAGSAAAAMMNRNRNIGDSRRMPFSRPPPERRRPIQKYEEEEGDEEMDDFVVDDEEEEEEVNDYSAEIGRIFRYNKKRYRNETFSDDDMEADAREVLREEKRSERIGRREDIEEEKRELERLKRLKMKGKSRS